MKNGSKAKWQVWSTYRVVFLTGPALKVLSVEDGKIPTKKVKVHGKFLCDTFAFTFLVGILPSSTLLGRDQSKKHPNLSWSQKYQIIGNLMWLSKA